MAQVHGFARCAQNRAWQEGLTLNTSIAPTAGQLAAARLSHWHQDAQPLLTLDVLREWINTAGLLLYTPRPQFPVPAPSFVEAILGASTPAPTLAQLDQPRILLARLIAEGAVIPLHLFGSPTGAGSETPDFLVPPAVLGYIFTLRGDKAWKQPPVTSGAAKVSPLALASFNLLTEKGRLTASELAAELGNEVTEAAALRALTELWEHLRVLPVPQADGTSTLWELTTTRYNRQIKSGANAGVPTALSALISLYLGQVILPTEEDVESFLSPLSARSRIREVVRALTVAQQIQSHVIEGKTHLFVPGELPVFLPEVAEPAPDDVDSIVVTTEGEIPPASPSNRISKFAPSFRKRSEHGADRETNRRPRPAGDFSDRPARRPEQRRPFNRSAQASQPDFSRPWDEEKRERAERRPRSDDRGEQQSRPWKPRPRPEEPGAEHSSADRPARRSFGPKSASRPFSGPKGNRSGFARTDRPGFNRSDRSDSPRGDRSGFPRKDRSDFPKGDRPSFPRKERSEFPRGDRPSFPRKERSDFAKSDRPSFPRKDRSDFSRGDRPSFPRKDRSDFPKGDRPSFPRKERSDSPKGERSGFARKERFDSPKGDRPSFPRKERSEFSKSDRPSFPRKDRSSFSKSDRPSFPRKDRSGFSKSDRPAFAKKDRSGPAGSSRPRSSSPSGGPFDKFKGNKKPFGKRGAPPKGRKDQQS
ncbi:MAG TPA: hypothetical protein VL495_02830 [Edaphobacter sp.]|nr:hypothetical protein [Edaphobacter sp.]